MDVRRVVVLVIDRLGAGCLGPYGNTWIETPNWNRLAAESFLFDFALTDSPRLGAGYRSYWRGQHAVSDEDRGTDLARQVQDAGLSTTLLADDPLLAGLAGASSFHERIVLPGPAPSDVGEAVEQTHLGRLFSAAIDILTDRRGAGLLWIHAQGMQGPWDAPLEFRNQFAEEDDPLPPEFVTPPQKRLVKPYDPDEVLGVNHAFAGQVVLLDVCLGALLDALQASEPADRPLLLVTSPRGYPLGEHGLIGHGDDCLHEESLHVPLLIRFPDQSYAAQRSAELIQPPDVYATVLDGLSQPWEDSSVWGRSLLPLIRGDAEPPRDRAVSVAGEHRGIRTPAWYLVRHPDGSRELYAKPDDRWEMNEISRRCEPIVVELEQVLDQFPEAVRAGRHAGLLPLADST
jgi:arylsulfatase A-like enzyme